MKGMPMKRIVAMGMASLSLLANAEPVKAQTPTPTATEKASPGTRYTYKVTLEKLDLYLRLRTEVDAMTRKKTAEMLQQAREGKGDLMTWLKQGAEATDNLRKKVGLAQEDYDRLDPMVRDISMARFMPESVAMNNALKDHEENAAQLRGNAKQTSQAFAAILKNQMEKGPALKEQRQAYGDANVDLVLRREKELKELFLASDAMAVEAAKALRELAPTTL